VGVGDVVVITNQTKMTFQLVCRNISLGVSVKSMLFRAGLMILMAEVTTSGSGDGDGDRGSSGSNNRKGRNRDNSDRSRRNGVDWKVEQIRGMDGEEMMSVAMELGMGVTAEDI
jgi:hypothetical protein